MFKSSLFYTVLLIFIFGVIILFYYLNLKNNFNNTQISDIKKIKTDNNINTLLKKVEKNSMYTSWKIAKEDDVNEWNAVFVLKNKEWSYIWKPYIMKIPQIVYFNDEDEKRKEWILIQSEITPENDIYAWILLEDGTNYAWFLNDFELTIK